MEPDSPTNQSLEADEPSGGPVQPSLLSLLGIGREVFQSVGGGEAFIRHEREHFYDAGEDADPSGAELV
jgi:hypothetical protein